MAHRPILNGAERARTANPRVANAVLSQLSYGPETPDSSNDSMLVKIPAQFNDEPGAALLATPSPIKTMLANSPIASSASRIGADEV